MLSQRVAFELAVSRYDSLPTSDTPIFEIENRETILKFTDMFVENSIF